MKPRSGVYDAMSAGRFLKIKKEFFTAFFEALESNEGLEEMVFTAYIVGIKLCFHHHKLLLLTRSCLDLITLQTFFGGLYSILCSLAPVSL